MRNFFDWSGHPLSHDLPEWGVSAVEGAAPVFRHLPAPTGAELQELVQQIAARIGRMLEQRGIVERDMENAWLAMQG
jgi:hypothetical protein